MTPSLPAFLAVLLVLTGPIAAAGEAAVPAVVSSLTAKQVQTFLTAAAAGGAKRDEARAEVEAWGPLGPDAAKQLRQAVGTKWPFAPIQGRTGGLREVNVPGLEKRRYFLAMPDNYSPQRNWPLALSLHGAGGDGAGEYAGSWKKWRSLWPGLVACPSGEPLGATWFPEQRPFVLAVLEDVRRNFAIEDNAIVLNGFSIGGHAAWYYGQYRTSQWSAMITRGGSCPEGMLINLLHLPCTIVHGTADSVIPIGSDRKAAARLKALGYDVTFLELPGDHSPFVDQVNPKVIPWLGRQRRDPYPKRLVMLNNEPEDHRCYWVDCVKRSGAQVQVEAVVLGQTIALTMRGGTAATLWLADDLLDLDQPVLVTWNGKQVHAGLVPRRGSDLLAWLDATFDRAAAPIAHIDLTAP